MSKITISGFPGAGKTTVGKILAEKLEYNFHSMGSLRRKMAQEKGMTIQELNEIGEKEDWTDKDVDKYQETFGKEEDNFIFEGRLAFYFIPDSLKIFLKIDENIGAERILQDKRENEEKGKTLEEMVELNKKRVKSDIKRYEQYYQINCYDISHYDLIIDTSEKTPEEVVQKIADFVNKDL